jgi:hypothetical protein
MPDEDLFNHVDTAEQYPQSGARSIDLGAKRQPWWTPAACRPPVSSDLRDLFQIWGSCFCPIAVTCRKSRGRRVEGRV